MNWYTQHELYDEKNDTSVYPLANGVSNTSAAWHASLRQFLDGPGRGFADNVQFETDNGTRLDVVTSTSMPVFWKFVNDKTAAAAGVRRMIDQREIAKDAAPGLSPIVFHEVFVFFEGLAVVVRETVQSLCFAALAVFIVLLLMLANVQMAVMILCVCGEISICLLGSIHWCWAESDVRLRGPPRPRRRRDSSADDLLHDCGVTESTSRRSHRLGDRSLRAGTATG